MERRKFIKASCQLCLLGAAGYMLPMLSSCGTTKSTVYKADIQDKKITVPLALFATCNLQMVRPKGWFYDIAVQKNEDDTYSALLMKCTHMDNQLVLAGNGFQCNLHGSHFDKTGKVQKGPAEMPLKHFTITKDQTNLTINI